MEATPFAGWPLGSLRTSGLLTGNGSSVLLEEEPAGVLLHQLKVPLEGVAVPLHDAGGLVGQQDGGVVLDGPDALALPALPAGHVAGLVADDLLHLPDVGDDRPVHGGAVRRSVVVAGGGQRVGGGEGGEYCDQH